MSFYAQYRRDMKAARDRVRASGSRIVETVRGPVDCVDCGYGPPVLWVHGILGGSDQGPAASSAYLGPGFRTIAVSRFGYLDSPLPRDASPAAQADVYAALLDALGIQTAALVGMSAGTASSLQFALRHPGRCAVLVLWSMAVPPYKVPPMPLLAVIRAFYSSDLAAWAMIRYTPALMLGRMGVPRPIQKRLSPGEREWLSSLMQSFLPISLRIDGIMNDICVSNPGMNKIDSFEYITIPTLIAHARDDPMPPFAGAKQIAGRFPNARFVKVNDGGHLLLGHQETVRAEISGFIRRNVGDTG